MYFVARNICIDRVELIESCVFIHYCFVEVSGMFTLHQSRIYFTLQSQRQHRQRGGRGGPGAVCVQDERVEESLVRFVITLT